MELRHLRYFVAVADAGSVSRAAVQLRVTQPALSRQIRDLEAELELPLFDRVGRRLQLTAAGDSLLLRTREILREARQFNPKEFRIVASPAVVEMLLDEESQHLAELSGFIGKPISLGTEPTMNPEQYDIVLM